MRCKATLTICFFPEYQHSSVRPVEADMRHIESLCQPQTKVMKNYKKEIFTHNKAKNRVTYEKSCKIQPQTSLGSNHQP